MSRLAVVRLTFAALLAASLLAPARVFAGGLEYTAAGATALGRGGAVTARADDPMVLSYNPAGLVELRGSQLLFDANVVLMNACVDPIGYYGWGVYGGGTPSAFTDPKTGKREVLNLGQPDPATGKLGPAEQAYYEDPLDTVCMDQHVQPIPQLIVTSRLSEDFGIGGGFVFPAITPSGQWGDAYGQVRGDTGGLRPAATRYMMMNTGNLGVFPGLREEGGALALVLYPVTRADQIHAIRAQNLRQYHRVEGLGRGDQGRHGRLRGGESRLPGGRLRRRIRRRLAASGRQQ